MDKVFVVKDSWGIEFDRTFISYYLANRWIQITMRSLTPELREQAIEDGCLDQWLDERFRIVEETVRRDYTHDVGEDTIMTWDFTETLEIPGEGLEPEEEIVNE